ncbi:hypothetical protein PAI11_35070 [Patulibacter medicamentivorans]|uniref:Uncharacterized protein n=1 Tax=Patulibacter medicamentivorans TaxID=1097667 RepID=H0E9I8_9ACTN|nr:hypothetical protein PAI11_35070 [Patulibacter medicamentivorans]
MAWGDPRGWGCVLDRSRPRGLGASVGRGRAMVRLGCDVPVLYRPPRRTRRRRVGRARRGWDVAVAQRPLHRRRSRGEQGDVAIRSRASRQRPQRESSALLANEERRAAPSQRPRAPRHRSSSQRGWGARARSHDSRPNQTPQNEAPTPLGRERSSAHATPADQRSPSNCAPATDRPPQRRAAPRRTPR